MATARSRKKSGMRHETTLDLLWKVAEAAALYLQPVAPAKWGLKWSREARLDRAVSKLHEHWSDIRGR